MTNEGFLHPLSLYTWFLQISGHTAYFLYTVRESSNLYSAVSESWKTLHFNFRFNHQMKFSSHPLIFHFLINIGQDWLLFEHSYLQFKTQDTGHPRFVFVVSKAITSVSQCINNAGEKEWGDCSLYVWKSREKWDIVGVYF